LDYFDAREFFLLKLCQSKYLVGFREERTGKTNSKGRYRKERRAESADFIREAGFQCD
jgi:hypothetical protein